MRTTTTILAVFVALVLVSPHSLGAGERQNGGVTRTYDVYDFFWYSADDNAGEGGTLKARAESLVDLVKETIEPGKWEGPGAAYAMEAKDARLVVTAPEPVHAMLAELLRQLRETAAVQGVSLDCHFILADEPFLKRHWPAALNRKGPGASVRGITLLQARAILDAARETPGVVVLPAPPLPLYAYPTSFLIGEERRLKLWQIGGGANVEVARPSGLSLAVEAIAGPRLVTLDLMARSATLDAMPGGTFEEVEGLYHGTFALERSGGFLVRAPLVRAKLAGVREVEGAGQEIVREATAEQSDPPRYLLVVGTVRTQSAAELTLLAGARVAQSVADRFGGAPDAPPPPPRPGERPPPPVPPGPPERSTRVFDLRPLLLGPEQGPARAAARAKRLERVMAKVKAAVGDNPERLREQNGQLIVTALPQAYEKITAVLDELAKERVVEPE